ncbi:MAG: DALR anticodon-binding domain-containing protein, partial [Pseudonocardiaceae bacterium]
ITERRAREVGIGAVKYADLATGRTRDYIFDVNRMVSLNGNTGVYLQYAHARVCSILRKLPPEDLPAAVNEKMNLEPAERKLAMLLDEFSEVINSVGRDCEPHQLCGYLYAVAQTFTEFYGACPVLKAPSDEVRNNRVVMCQLTGRTLELGLQLLGIEAPERL